MKRPGAKGFNNAVTIFGLGKSGWQKRIAKAGEV